MSKSTLERDKTLKPRDYFRSYWELHIQRLSKMPSTQVFCAEIS